MRLPYLIILLLCFADYGSAQDSKILKGDKIFGQMRARQIGPAVMSGRVIDIEMHPTDGNTFYVGSAGGGVWKTQDAGITFKPVFDDHIQSIGTIAIDPTEPDKNIWVGTGEIWTRNSVSIGDGLYKSEDGGKKWKKIGFENSERIAGIEINPDNNQEIYVGVLGPLWGDSNERGVFKSVDGGASWENILQGDASTGCSDLFMDPNDPNTLYASMWEFRRTAWSFNSGGIKSALFKSTDGGQSWDKIHNGFPEGKMGRIGFALAPSDSNILYAVIETEDEEGKGLYRSENGGESWEQTNNDFELTVRPFYFSRIVVSPHDPNTIAKAGLFGTISQDGGKTFRGIQGGVHPDIHDYVFHPTDKDRIVLGCDGGVYRSFDGGNVWSMSMGLPLSQFYHVTVDKQTPYKIYGGLQDNGSWIGTSESDGGIGPSDWRSVGAGDGFRVYPHPEDNNIVYSEMQGAENVWRVDVRRNQAKIIKPYPEENDPKLRFNWNAPIATGLHNPDALFVGSQFVHKSEDRGESWKKISPDLTTNDKSKQNQSESGGISTDNSGAENHCTVFTIAESPLDENVIWAGTDDGNVQVTFDGGEKWNNVTKNLTGLPKNTWCYHIEPSIHDQNVAYAVFDGHTQNDINPYVYKTIDGGKSWKNIATSEIPSFARSIQEDFEDPDLLYLGTETGLYITLDGGNYWAHFNNNVPPVAIHHVTMQARENALIMGTHGRGVIIIDDVTPLRQIDTEMLDDKVYFFEKEARIMDEGGSGFGGFGMSGEYVGENPTSSAEIVYYLNKRHTFGKMKVEVLDKDGKVIADLSPGKSKGINIVKWNYRHKMPKIAEGKTFTFGGFSTPMVPPGTYKVRMTKGKEVYESDVSLKPDPNSAHSPEELQAGYEAAMRLYNMNEQLAYIISQTDGISSGLDGVQNSDLPKKLKEGIRDLSKDLAVFKKPLVVMTGDNYVGAAEPQLREKIASLYGDVASYPGTPSKGQIQNMEQFDAKLQKVQGEMNEKIETLNKINKMLEKEGLPVIKLGSKENFMKA